MEINVGSNAAPKKKILFVASEAAPFITTGGLGEITGALPCALMETDPSLDVRAVIPLYGEIAEKYKNNVLEAVGTIYVDLGWRHQYCGIYKAVQEQVTYYFIDNEYYFKREGCYGYFDDGERFAFFCKAVLDMLDYIGFIPDIIHCHDWQSALLPVYLNTTYAFKQSFRKIKTVFTIHNIEYQGKYDKSVLGDIFDIPYEYLNVVEHDGALNLMKGAMVCSDSISTLSASYAQQIRDPYYAYGLEDIVNMENAKIHGIMHGIDYNLYNPETDEKIYKNYTADTIRNKRDNKLQLQTIYSLKNDENIPVIAVIAHLVKQKGIDCIVDAMNNLVGMPVQFILLGDGDHKYELLFESYREMYPEKISVNIRYDPDMAHRIYAGADMLLKPPGAGTHSITHMIASRYGALPIVRNTGVKRNSASYGADDSGNRFTFKNNIADVVNRALKVYNRPEEWSELASGIMRHDFSWNASALKYIDMYRKV